MPKVVRPPLLKQNEKALYNDVLSEYDKQLRKHCNGAAMMTKTQFMSYMQCGSTTAYERLKSVQCVGKYKGKRYPIIDVARMLALETVHSNSK